MIPWLVPLLMTGMFTILGALVGSVLLIRHSNNVHAKGYEMLIQTEIAQLKINQNHVCPAHTDAFKAVHSKRENFEKSVADKIEDFGKIVISLDKNVAVFTEQLKHLANTCNERRTELDKIHDKIDNA